MPSSSFESVNAHSHKDALSQMAEELTKMRLSQEENNRKIEELTLKVEERDRRKRREEHGSTSSSQELS